MVNYIYIEMICIDHFVLMTVVNAFSASGGSTKFETINLMIGDRC